MDYEVQEKLNVSNMSTSGASPLVRAVTSKQELYLESLEEVVAFLQAQGVSRMMEIGFLGKHTAFVALVQSTFDLAENHLQWIVKENVEGFTKPRIAFGLPWPLHHIVAHSTALAYWWNHGDVRGLSLQQVEEKVEELCVALETILEGEQAFFPGVVHCPMDALVWGHLEALLTATVPVNPFPVILQKHPKLQKFHKSYGSLRGDLGLVL